uniref:Uncharacterized protein n=1 Tax=Anopheles dirus TaxID=7168 RepID=A0A182NXG1_9DIPT
MYTNNPLPWQFYRTAKLVTNYQNIRAPCAAAVCTKLLHRAKKVIKSNKLF